MGSQDLSPRRGVSYNSIRAVHNAILKGEDARLHVSVLDFLEVFVESIGVPQITMDGNAEIYRLVLQKNIGDLGYLFPLLSVAESAS
ncbi:unnamed protein product [Heligmosomoides polygyrus]|uniref:Rho-GAP domain-containing protein n=1 Tax=Heligmosomoides polygyrus TaxID=6339 RepID=A0A183G864_HELPZ|nr:unnamed protein product [Heligmosomoides polygyrus]